MEKKLITMTNGASAEDISDAIGKFLEQRNQEQAKGKKNGKRTAAKVDPASGPKNK